MLSGEGVGNVQGSECFAYGSAAVDPVLKRAWVFGERDLCGGKSRDNSTACAPFWQGRRKAGNGVRAWWSDDLVQWHTAQEPALIYPSYPVNTDVTPVVGKSLLTRADGSRAIVDSDSLAAADGEAQPLNFVLVSESGRIATHAGPDRNLSKGWVHFKPENHSSSKGFGACPAVHYGEEDGQFYVISVSRHDIAGIWVHSSQDPSDRCGQGGTAIALARSSDLENWEHTEPLVPTPDPWSGANFRDDNVQLSEFLGIRQQATGDVPATAEHQRVAASLRSTVAHPSCWEKDVNDADMCCGGPLTAPGAPQSKAWVLFSPSSQGAPPHSNCSGINPPLEKTNFNGIASANTSLTKLLASRFKSDDAGIKSQRAWSAEGAALTGVTFSFLNQFNSPPEPIQFVDSSVQLFAGAWAPSPLAPPLSGSLPPVKGNALRYGFRAEVDPLVPPGDRINGTFQLRPAPNAGNLSQGFAAFGFVLVPVGAGRQEFIVQTEGATWDELASQSYTVMVGGEVVVTVLLHHRDCLPSCHPLCTC